MWAHALDEGAEQLACELGVVFHPQHVWEPVARAACGILSRVPPPPDDPPCVVLPPPTDLPCVARQTTVSGATFLMCPREGLGWAMVAVQ
jgi:hypothetical protein